MTPSDDLLLIDALRRKHAGHDTAGFHALDFVGAFGSPIDALMYARLFWPEFVRFEGMVFRQEDVESEDDRQRVREALIQNGGDKRHTEESFNIVEVPIGLFSRAAESSAELDRVLLAKLVEMWTCRLAVAFPGEEFVVVAVPPEDNGGDPAITFYTRIHRG